VIIFWMYFPVCLLLCLDFHKYGFENKFSCCFIPFSFSFFVLNTIQCYQLMLYVSLLCWFLSLKKILHTISFSGFSHILFLLLLTVYDLIFCSFLSLVPTIGLLYITYNKYVHYKYFRCKCVQLFL
jgi:hypothetical protein